jgi:hypothetical protein
MTIESNVAQLFDEFVDAHVAGQRPDVREYLGRAGTESRSLGVLIDRYLQVAPVAEPDAETVVMLNARLEHLTPLTAARRRLPLRVDEVVEPLRRLLGLDEESRVHLREAYQQLEAEQLDPTLVDRSVWEALRSILGLDPRRLMIRDTRAFAAPAFMRAASIDVEAAPARRSVIATDQSSRDQVDRLFRGGGSG